MGSKFLKSRGIGEDSVIQSGAGRGTRKFIRFLKKNPNKPNKNPNSGGNRESSTEDGKVTEIRVTGFKTRLNI